MLLILERIFIDVSIAILAYITLVAVVVLFTAYGLPFFCWVARFLGWPWRRSGRS